jgi:hypothetical protein
MAKKPKPSKPIRWGIYKLAAKAVWLGNVEAPDEAAAIEKGAAEFKVPANRLAAIRRCPPLRRLSTAAGYRSGIG